MRAKKSYIGRNKYIKVFLITMLIVILALSISFFSIFFSIKIDDEKIIRASAKINVFDDNNNLIDMPLTYESFVKYEDINENIINAFVALEDKRFFDHKGIDYIRIGGATLNNIKAGYFKEGGSTITQQLAKNIQLTNEKTLNRKIKEAKLAKDIEKEFSKEQIIEMYLNAIYFGNGIYGINNACKRYFDKQPADIKLFEAALLAGIVRSPEYYSPLRNAEKAEERKNLVLRLMKEQKYINENEYIKALEKKYIPLKENPFDNNPYSRYYSNVIYEASGLLNITEKALINQNYKIYTYMNDNLQNVVYNGFTSKEFEKQNTYGNSPSYYSLILDNKSGGVQAYYGNIDYNVFEFRRQPGSTIKPIIVYSPCFNSHYITPATLYLDEKTDFDGYSPSNYGENYQGWIDIRNAVKFSSNVVAVKLLNEYGIDYAKETASKMGLVFDERDNYLPLALGGMTYGTNPLEISESYMCFANNGFYQKSSFIKKIIDADGKIIFNNEQTLEKAISSEAAYLMTDILIDTAKSGTAKKLSSLPYQIASKTGTVGDPNGIGNSDAWNLSYSSENTICVWYGNVNKNPEYNIDTTGGGYPSLFAKYIYENISNNPKNFDIPNNIIELNIDSLALEEMKQVMLAGENTPNEYQKKEIFDINNAPTEYSLLFEMPETNFHIEFNEEEQPVLHFETESLYQYTINKNNLVYGTTSKIANIKNTEESFIFVDKSNDNNELVSYSITVSNKYGEIGTTEEQIILFKTIVS